MLVAILIGVMVSIAVPRLDLSRIRTDAAARTAMMTMLGAQRGAVQRQHDIVVAFDSVRRIIRVHSDLNNNLAIDAGENVNHVQIESGIVFGPGTATARPIGGGAVTFTRLQGGLPSVTFTRAGTATQFGGFYLRSTKAGTQSSRVHVFEVERGTGRTSRLTWANGAWQRGF